MTDQDREQEIAACGRHVLACYAAGDRDMARAWFQALVLAVKERSKTQIARMEEDYFSAEGERARMAALVKACS